MLWRANALYKTLTYYGPSSVVNQYEMPVISWDTCLSPFQQLNTSCKSSSFTPVSNGWTANSLDVTSNTSQLTLTVTPLSLYCDRAARLIWMQEGLEESDEYGKMWACGGRGLCTALSTETMGRVNILTSGFCSFYSQGMPKLLLPCLHSLRDASWMEQICRFSENYVAWCSKWNKSELKYALRKH